ncbi:activating signal cointegrator 1 [Anopheles nili]|uniref:activating signal cointegrator 1 n=1 Tax=Anopheles nili TaxID=185578 RepID=UPI00237B0BC4|nr:activating signal cointegrator 1 [Anopheles nili]XP_053678381.1 activating signal cointegrator 1 [Anopheles nili]
MDQWIKEELSKCLLFDVPDPMVSFIRGMANIQEIDEYFRSLLDFNDPQHVAFLGDLKFKLCGSQNDKPVQPLKGATSKAGGKNKQPPKQQNQQQAKGSKSTYNGGQVATTATKPAMVAKPPETSAKKKTKYVNLYGQDGELADVAILKGRHHCDCQASKHRLVNNCIHCGRIVCEQEGSGPCLFCGSLVCTESEQRLIDGASRKGDNLRRTLMEQTRPAGWEEALATRNRLLEYDRNSEKRTTVIDDESDYFKTNSVWLSDAERQAVERLEAQVRENRHASRLSRKITLDFAGRQVLDEAPMTDSELQEILKRADQIGIGQTVPLSGPVDNENTDPDWSQANENVHPGLVGPAPTFVNTGRLTDRPAGVMRPQGFDGIYSRVQDKEFLEMSDQRHCLSMHQPWASLLVAGIKRHEGRTWYSSHRGRLWIAATAKPVCPETVRELEAFYRQHYNDEKIEFPTQYPSGCLLGCVSVQDCLPQEEYRKQHPSGESDSPFVFVCSVPQTLPVQFPIKGEHKIYMLDSKIHQAAALVLQRLTQRNKDQPE